MSADKRLWLFVLAALVAGLVLGAAGSWAVQQRHVAELEEEAAKGAEAQRSAQELAVLVAERDRMVDQLTGRVNELKRSLEASSSLHGTGDASSAGENVRQFAYLESITVGSKPSLRADYAQFLMGDAAADAAKAAGGDSPPPNDYYIVNESGMLRTITVDPKAEVRLTSRPGAGADADGYASDLKTLSTYLASDTEETAGLRADGFWLTMKDGVVTSIEEQYVP